MLHKIQESGFSFNISQQIRDPPKNCNIGSKKLHLPRKGAARVFFFVTDVTKSWALPGPIFIIQSLCHSPYDQYGVK